MANHQDPSVPSNKRAAIDSFRKKLADQAAGVAPGERGRLIFALDATQSRQPTWDLACEILIEMFAEAARNGGLDIQLIYYRGMRECRASSWMHDANVLVGLMGKVKCVPGLTQIGRIIEHVRQEHMRQKIGAVVFVGDCVEEDGDALCAAAAEVGVRFFVFQEGDDSVATEIFKRLADVTKGAHCHFTPGAARELAELLRAVATYAAGGRNALLTNKTAAAAKLLLQLPPR
jgi:hypothetical protein